MASTPSHSAPLGPSPVRGERCAAPAQPAASAPPGHATREPGADATLGAVVAIVLGLATARWWSPLVSVALGLAVAVLIAHWPPRRARRAGPWPAQCVTKNAHSKVTNS